MKSVKSQMINSLKVIASFISVFLYKQSLCKLLRQYLNDWLKHIKGTLKLKLSFLNTSRSLKMSSLNNLLTLFLIIKSGTMQLSLYQMPNLQTVRYIHFHLMNRRNWISSYKRTWTLEEYDHHNPQWHLQCSSLRRRMVF